LGCPPASVTACEAASTNRLIKKTMSNGSRSSLSFVEPRISTNMLTTYRSSPILIRRRLRTKSAPIWAGKTGMTATSVCGRN
jgi:hypothetical protein